jgi:hypothetical protein
MKFIAFFISVLLCAPSFAEKICFKDGTEHESIKEKLPDIFKSLPIVLGGEKPGMLFDIIAVVKIHFYDKTIVMDSDVWKPPGHRYNNRVEAEKVCYETTDKTFVINFKNGAKPFKAVYSTNAVVVSGVTLKPQSPKQQLDLIRKLEDKEAPRKNSGVN